MSPSNRRNFLRAAIAVALLVPAIESRALAQTAEDRDGFGVREVSLSTGYASLQLPPITLGGNLPNDVLNADLISTATAQIDWRRVRPRTIYVLDLAGTYTARTRYTQLSAPGANLSFGVSHTAGTKWQVGAGVAGAMADSDQMAFQPTQTERLVGGARSFDDLAGTVALARSPSPDLTQAALFVPISQTLVGSDLYGNRIVTAATRADAIYTHSVRFAAAFHGGYTTARRLSSSREPGQVLDFTDSTAENAGIELRFGRSERRMVTTDLTWSRTSGVFADEIVIANVGYGWSGRKWFTMSTIGAALRPFQSSIVSGTTTTADGSRPAIVGDGLVGYKFRTQTLLVQYRRASHDEYGHGGRNIATGFEGNVQTVTGSWSCSAPSGRWTVSSNVSMLRGPGNFSYIYAWLSTLGIGRQLGPGLRMVGEVLYDRHGSRMFEGFDLTRESARLNLVWTPRQRSIG
jgi:hypothetical protein